MAKLSKADRSRAAKKGAKTKAYQKALSTALTYQAMINNGTSVPHIANMTGQTVQDVLDTLKLLTLVPIPPLQEIGVAAHGVSLGKDILDTLGITPKMSRNVVTSHANTIKSMAPIIKDLTSRPESVRGDIINTLNSLGQEVTAPVRSAEDYFRKLITGSP